MMQKVKELPLVMIRKIGYSYPNGTVALKAIDLNIFKGELVGIMGKNGAGKTSLIISSKSIATLSKHVGIIFQNPSHQLFANSVEEEIKFSLKSFNLPKEEIQIKIDQILQEYNLEKYRNRSPLNLSGGESKKLAIASIICRNPEILVFDEPTLGQDAKEIEFFINLITRERKNGKTIIIITHNVEFAYEYIPRTILMADGQIIADGPTKKVLNNEFLINQTSLILPQIRQFNLVLQQNKFHDVEDVLSTNEMIDYLRNYIKQKSSNV